MNQTKQVLPSRAPWQPIRLQQSGQFLNLSYEDRTFLNRQTAHSLSLLEGKTERQTVPDEAAMKRYDEVVRLINSGHLQEALHKGIPLLEEYPTFWKFYFWISVILRALPGDANLALALQLLEHCRAGIEAEQRGELPVEFGAWHTGPTGEASLQAEWETAMFNICTLNVRLENWAKAVRLSREGLEKAHGDSRAELLLTQAVAHWHLNQQMEARESYRSAENSAHSNFRQLFEAFVLHYSELLAIACQQA